MICILKYLALFSKIEFSLSIIIDYFYAKLIFFNKIIPTHRFFRRDRGHILSNAHRNNHSKTDCRIRKEYNYFKQFIKEKIFLLELCN